MLIYTKFQNYPYQKMVPHYKSHGQVGNFDLKNVDTSIYGKVEYVSEDEWWWFFVLRSKEAKVIKAKGLNWSQYYTLENPFIIYLFIYF